VKFAIGSLNKKKRPLVAGSLAGLVGADGGKEDEEEEDEEDDDDAGAAGGGGGGSGAPARTMYLPPKTVEVAKTVGVCGARVGKFPPLPPLMAPVVAPSPGSCGTLVGAHLLPCVPSRTTAGGRRRGGWEACGHRGRWRQCRCCGCGCWCGCWHRRGRGCPAREEG
jgi:hypothetical protein